MIYSKINNVAWVVVWVFFAYIISVPIRILYDSIKKGWFGNNKNDK